MLMTIEEVANYLKVSKETIYKMAQKKQLPALKIGNQWRFKKQAIDHWIDTSTVNPENIEELNTIGSDHVSNQQRYNRTDGIS